MRTEDWVTVGLRLFGAYLMVQAFLGVVDFLGVSSGATAEPTLAYLVLRPLVGFVIGLCLFNWGKFGSRRNAERT